MPQGETVSRPVVSVGRVELWECYLVRSDGDLVPVETLFDASGSETHDPTEAAEAYVTHGSKPGMVRLEDGARLLIRAEY